VSAIAPVAAPHHDWRFAAPAYGGADAVPNSPPELQMYDSSDLVNAFLKDPTAFLPFGDEDVVYEPAGGSLLHKTETRKLFLDTHKRFYLVVCELHCLAAGFPNASRDDVCEAGFVIRRRITPARAFEGVEDELTQLLRNIQQAKSTITLAEEGLSRARASGVGVAVVEDPPEASADVVAHGRASWLGAVTEPMAAVASEEPAAPATSWLTGLFGKSKIALSAAPESIVLKRAAMTPADQAQAQLENWQAQLADLVDAHDLRLRLQGWYPNPVAAGIGSWDAVDESPQRTVETVYPLLPLVPDPRDSSHPAQGRTIYFGLVPTASADLDRAGNARFEDRSLYEIRCFVRRHDPRCPRKVERNDCRGTLFWSQRSQPYRLAAQLDLAGTANRPVAVQMPSLPALKAQAEALKDNLGAKLAKVNPDGTLQLDARGKPVWDEPKRAPVPCGRGAAVRLKMPPASLPQITVPELVPIPPSVSGLTSGELGLSIPLVTIVAMFVMKIFLAILSMIFPPINFIKQLGFSSSPELPQVIFPEVPKGDASLDLSACMRIGGSA
jgi:hypothetical protein